MVTFPDVAFVNLSIIGKAIAQELRLRTQEFMQQFTGETFLTKVRQVLYAERHG